MVIPKPKKVLSKIESCTNKPPCTWKSDWVVHYNIKSARCPYLTKFPYSFPEILYIFNRPPVESIVRSNFKTIPFIDKADEPGYICLFNIFLRRNPEWFFHFYAGTKNLNTNNTNGTNYTNKNQRLKIKN